MSRRAAITGAAAGLFLLPVSAAADGPRLAVIAVGPDDASAGSLQASVELLLADNVDVAVLRADAVARGVGTPAAPGVVIPAAQRQQWTRHLDAAAQAYYEDRLPKAAGELSSAARLQSAVLAPTADIVRLEVLRAAVAMARGEREEAASRAAAALVRQPDLTISSNEFPPSLVAVVDKARAQIEWGTLDLSTVPDSVQVRVDDRVIGRSERVPAGRHTLELRGMGFRPTRAAIQVQGMTRLNPGMRIAVSPTVHTRLQQMLWERVSGITKQDVQVLGEIARRLRVERLLVTGVVPGTKTSGLLWGPGLSPQRVTVEGAGPTQFRNIAVWSQRALTREVVPTGRSWGGIWSFAGNAGVALGYTERKVRGDGGGELDSGWFGAGAQLEGYAFRTPIVVQARMLVLNHDFAPSSFNLPSGERVDLGGGTFFQLRGGAGFQREFDSVRFVPQLRVVALPWYEQLTAEDLRDASGRLGLLPSHRSFGFDAEVGGAATVYGVELSVDFVTTIFGTRSEDPDGTTGSDPRLQPTFGMRLGAAMTRDGPWEVGLTWELHRRHVRFVGGAQAQTAPPLSDANARESRNGFVLQVRRAF